MGKKNIHVYATSIRIQSPVFQLNIRPICVLFLVDQAQIEEQTATIYKVIHTVNFNTSIQAFMLLYHVMDVR